MSKSPYDIFGTDPSLEVTGIRIDYGSFYFQIARAGGENTKFRTIVREKMAPYQRAIELGEMDEKVALKVTGEAFAESVVLGWGSPEFGEGKVPGRDGKPVDFSVEACKQMFADLPEMLDDLMKQATKLANFRKAAAADDAGN